MKPKYCLFLPMTCVALLSGTGDAQTTLPKPDTMKSWNGTTVGIVAGNTSGATVQLGEDIARLCWNDGQGFPINVISSGGGFDTFRCLTERDEVQFAIANADTWALAYAIANAPDDGHWEYDVAKKMTGTEVSVVMPLTTEIIHFVTTKNKRYNGMVTVRDLFTKHAVVGIGTSGSTSHVTSRLINTKISKDPSWTGNQADGWIRVYSADAAALRHLRDQTPVNSSGTKLDAVLLVGNAPFPALEQYGDTLVLLQLDDQTHRDLGSFYASSKNVGSGVPKLGSSVYPESMLPDGGLDILAVSSILFGVDLPGGAKPSDGGQSDRDYKDNYMQQVVYRLISDFSKDRLLQSEAWERDYNASAKAWRTVNPKAFIALREKAKGLLTPQQQVALAAAGKSSPVSEFKDLHPIRKMVKWWEGYSAATPANPTVRGTAVR